MTDPDLPDGAPPMDADSWAAREPATHLVVDVDGASSGNPGPCGCAAVAKTPDGQTVLEKARAFGPATNNVAEYQALILGLEVAATLNARHLTIRSDSQLLVRQLAGQYKVRSPHLRPLWRQARAMLTPFETVEIEQISRDQNKQADALARKALQKARQVDAELPPDARKHPPQKTFRLK